MMGYIACFRPRTGDYFLSLPSIIMITTAFKPLISAKSSYTQPELLT